MSCSITFRALPGDKIIQARLVRAEGEMQTADIIVRDPEILGGTPVFRSTRVPFQALLDYLEGEQTLAEFLDDFPTVTKDAAIAALELARSLVVGQLG